MLYTLSNLETSLIFNQSLFSRRKKKFCSRVRKLDKLKVWTRNEVATKVSFDRKKYVYLYMYLVFSLSTDHLPMIVL